MLPRSTVRRGQDTANLRDIASCEVWMEVHGMVGKDTMRYQSMGTSYCEVRGCEVLLNVILLRRCMYDEVSCEVPCVKCKSNVRFPWSCQ